MRFLKSGTIAAFFALLNACSSSSEPTPVATALVAAVTPPSSAPVASVVTPGPSVRVNDQNGKPMTGVMVAFSVAGGGSIGSPSAVTDENGLAAPGAWTLGTASGANTVTATVGNVPPLEFSVTATAGAAAALEKVAGDNQTAAVGAPVATAPTVRVKDTFGNPVSGVSVTFSVIAGGGIVHGSTPVSSDAGLVAPLAWTLGTTAGPNTLSATATGVASVSFGATGTPGPPTTVQKVDGDNQTAAAGTAVAVAPSVRVQDVHGNGVVGATVTFAVASGGGSITQGAQISNSTGVATVGSWTLGTELGANTLTAFAPGLVSVTFNATAVTDPCADRGTLTLGVAGAGTLTTSDCTLASGQFADFFNLSVPSAQAVLATMSSTAFDTHLGIFTSNGHDVAQNNNADQTTTNSSIKALVNPGSLLVRAAAFNVGATGAYTLSANTTSTSVGGCEDVFLMRGVTTQQVIETTDCADVAGTNVWYGDGYWIFVAAGTTLTIDMSSTAVDSYLELYRASTGARVAFNDDRAAGTLDAQIAFTTSQAGLYLIFASTALTQETGAYTLTATQVGVSGASPLSASLSSGSAAESLRLGGDLRGRSARGILAGAGPRLTRQVVPPPDQDR